MEFVSSGLDDLEELAAKIVRSIGEHSILAFYGEMGVGKTTLILKIAKVLGSTNEGSSPTFSIVNEYRDNLGKPFYHFDFYRINSIEEAYDLGYEEYFYSNSICLIEWPERIEELLPDDTVKFYLRNSGNKRIIKIEMPS